VGIGVSGITLGAQWALHIWLRSPPFPPYSLASFIIRHTPGSLATAAIDRLGHNALPALGWLAIVAALIIGVGLARRTPAVQALAAATLTIAAGVADPIRPGIWPVMFAAGVGASSALSAAVLVGARAPGGSTVDAGRRRVVAAGALGVGIVWLMPAAALRALRHLAPAPVRADRAAPGDSEPSFDTIVGLSSLVTARTAHYTVDIDLDFPTLDEASWRLHVHGLVEHPISFTLADLRAELTEERLITLSCISNPVGGPLVGNARWTGLPLAELLRRAHPARSARFVVARGADAYSETYPLVLATSAEPLVAFGMDGELLPAAHGYPARLVIPGHYGMKSVKWLTDLVIVDRDPVGYWGQRGWTEPAVTRTESRIDTPRPFATVRSPVTVAGVAWAGDRRVADVEVSADGGTTWNRADLEREQGRLSWRRWRAVLILPPGRHTLTVRAIDGTGVLQSAERLPPHPSGASGYHRADVIVAG
jgi:DMSO/TMAO reductase YedYZ molybdopterin-dependent catalytic subunit